MENTFRVDLDLTRPRFWSDFEVTQNDSVKFIVRMMKDGVFFPLTNVVNATLVSRRQDGQAVVKEGIITPGTNEVVFDLGTTELAIKGRVEAVVQLYDDKRERVSSRGFYYNVSEDLTGSGYIPSENEQTLITRVLNEGPSAIQAAMDASQAAAEKGDYALLQAEQIREIETLLQEAQHNALLAEEQLKSSMLVVEQERLAAIQATTETIAAKDTTITAVTDVDQVRVDTLNVKNATESVRSATEAVRIATEAVRVATDKARTDTIAVKDATELVRIATNTAKDNAVTATTNANTAKTNADTATSAANTAATTTNAVKTATEAVRVATEAVRVATETVRVNTDSARAATVTATTAANTATTAANTATTAANTAAASANTAATTLNTYVESGYMRIWTGTLAQYEAIAVKDNYTIYHVMG